MRRNLLVILTILLFCFNANSQQQAIAFTQDDHDRIIKTQVEVESFQKEMDGLQQQIVGLRQDINARFDDVNKRIDQTNTYMGWMMSLFGLITLGTFSFALWDRRTMIRPFETKVKEIETSIELKSTKMEKILIALRELAKTDSKVADILKNQNLL